MGTIAWCFAKRLDFYHDGDSFGMLQRKGKMPRILIKLHEQNGWIYRYFGLGEALGFDDIGMLVCEGDLILLISEGDTLEKKKILR